MEDILKPAEKTMINQIVMSASVQIEPIGTILSIEAAHHVKNKNITAPMLMFKRPFIICQPSVNKGKGLVFSRLNTCSNLYERCTSSAQNALQITISEFTIRGKIVVVRFSIVSNDFDKCNSFVSNNKSNQVKNLH